MKGLLFVSTLWFLSVSWALPSDQKVEKNFELIKCNSQKQGTLWASLLNVTSSKDYQLKYFIVEYAHFNADREAYTILNDIASALKGPEVRYGKGRFAFEFSSTFSGKTQNNFITLVSSVEGSNTDYTGNWKAVFPDGSEQHDLVACTIL